MGGVGAEYRCRGVDQHHASNLGGVLGGVGECVETPEGVAGQHVGARHVRALQQGVQIGGDLGGVLGGVGGVAPSAAGTVVDADAGVAGDGGCYPAHRRGRHAGARLEHDGGTAGAGAVQVQAVSSHVDQLARHLVVRCRSGENRFGAGPDRDDGEKDDHRVEEPAPEPTAHVSSDAPRHPDRECEHDRRPHPTESVVPA